MGRADRRRRKEKRKESFIQRNWKKASLGAATLGAAGLAAWGVATAIKPSTTGTPAPNQQKVERVLSIAKKGIGECYDAAYKYWQTRQGAINCNPMLDRMFSEIDGTARLGLEGEMAEKFKKLKAYLEQNGFFMDFLGPTLNGQVVPSFYIAPVTAESKEKLKLVEGETEVAVAYIGQPVIGHFFEERLSTPETRFVTGEIRREGKVYVRTDDAAGFANVLWDFYESGTYNSEISARKERARAYFSAANEEGFYRELGAILQFQEWKDVYDSVKSKGKGEFVRLFAAAKGEQRKYHGARHEMDAGKGYSNPEEEKRAKFQEILALPIYSPNFMLQGYGALGNAVDWFYSLSNDHKTAAVDVIGCYIGTIDNNRSHFPQLVHSDSPDKRERGFAIMQQFPLLTRDQIVQIADACWDSFYGGVEKKTRFNPGNNYPQGSQKEVWSRNQARHARDLKSRAKAYSL